MSLVFVDSNVLLYSEDSANAAKQQRAVDWLDALWTRRCGRLSIQVLSEFYTNATRGLQPAMLAPPHSLHVLLTRWCWRPLSSRDASGC